MRTHARLAFLLIAVLALAVLAGRGQPAYAWTYPAALNTNATTDTGHDEFPKVATDGAGNWVAVWDSNSNLSGGTQADYDILVARSIDNGATWTAPAFLNTNATTDSEADERPQVTTDGAGNWVTVWESYEDNLGPGIGTDADILVSRSTDNGASWTDPAALNTNAATDSGGDFYPQLTTDSAGNWVAVWQSTENMGGIGTDPDILVARSTDNGASWTDPAALNTNAATDSLGDYTPQVATDGAGNWMAVWHSWENVGGIGSDQDILMARSTDNGTTWTDPAALNANATTDSGDDAHAQVITDGGGNWVAAWLSKEDLSGTIGADLDILVARSTDSGASWTDPAALNTNADSDSGGDFYPQLTTDSAGNWVAVWESEDNLSGIGTEYDVLVARSTDNGASWTDPAALNTNATTDSGDDHWPQVTTDGGGHWVAVWDSWDDLGGTIDTDRDILYATEGPPPVGGIAEYPDVAAPAGGSGPSAGTYALLAGLVAAALLALTAGAWYARRRWVR